MNMSRDEDVTIGWGKWGCGGLIALAVILVLITCFTTVKTGEIGLVTQFGRATGRILQPGLNFKVPWPIQGVQKYNTQIRTWEASEAPAQSKANYTDVVIAAQTSDGQQITVTCATIFHIDPTRVLDVFTLVGPMDQVVENVVLTNTRAFTRQQSQAHSADDLYTTVGLLSYQKQVHDQLEPVFNKYGVILDEFLIKKVGWSDEYVKAVEAKQIAQQNIQTADYQAQEAIKKKAQTITEAQAKAEQTRLNAQAEADSTTFKAQAQAKNIVLVAEANAQAIRDQGQALHEFPEMLQYAFIQTLTNVTWVLCPLPAQCRYCSYQRYPPSN
jgi:regulator of protease activity HflC (stomatin/prohibitin superfamily)